MTLLDLFSGEDIGRGESRYKHSIGRMQVSWRYLAMASHLDIWNLGSLANRRDIYAKKEIKNEKKPS